MPLGFPEDQVSFATRTVSVVPAPEGTHQTRDAPSKHLCLWNQLKVQRETSDNAQQVSVTSDRTKVIR